MQQCSRRGSAQWLLRRRGRVAFLLCHYVGGGEVVLLQGGARFLAGVLPGRCTLVHLSHWLVVEGGRDWRAQFGALIPTARASRGHKSGLAQDFGAQERGPGVCSGLISLALHAPLLRHNRRVVVEFVRNGHCLWRLACPRRRARALVLTRSDRNLLACERVDATGGGLIPAHARRGMFEGLHVERKEHILLDACPHCAVRAHTSCMGGCASGLHGDLMTQRARERALLLGALGRCLQEVAHAAAVHQAPRGAERGGLCAGQRRK
mmetsp:Transcript_6847/g.19911  ORF Transcript_6847/g.19911 Transcript_6847/m.19911 type:complete len:265 (-) Transcript_6847:165-959(-)